MHASSPLPCTPLPLPCMPLSCMHAPLPCPPPCMPPAMHSPIHPHTHAPSPIMHAPTHPPQTCPPATMQPTWTEFLKDACENITFPQLLLRTVKRREITVSGNVRLGENSLISITLAELDILRNPRHLNNLVISLCRKIHNESN